MSDYRRDCDWWMDLLTTFTHDSDLQAIAASTLISTIHKSRQNLRSLFTACCVFTSRSLITTFKSADSSASSAQILSSQPPVQNSVQISLSYRTANQLNWTHCYNCPGYIFSARSIWKTLFFYCCVRVLCRGFTQLLPRNGRDVDHKEHFFLYVPACCRSYLIMASVFIVTS
jgi:hypothetical protein